MSDRRDRLYGAEVVVHLYLETTRHRIGSRAVLRISRTDLDGSDVRSREPVVIDVGIL